LLKRLKHFIIVVRVSDIINYCMSVLVVIKVVWAICILHQDLRWVICSVIRDERFIVVVLSCVFDGMDDQMVGDYYLFVFSFKWVGIRGLRLFILSCW
jgi:hypothetical protein